MDFPDRSAIILAGGAGRRVGGRDKGLIEFRGRPVIEHVIDAISPCCDDIVISANRNESTYETFASKVIADSEYVSCGPLSGIYSTLQQCQHDKIYVLACDMPHLDHATLSRLSTRATDADIIISASGGRSHLPLIIDRKVGDSLRASLQAGDYRLMKWAVAQDHLIVDFDDGRPFVNMNTLDDFT